MKSIFLLGAGLLAGWTGSAMAGTADRVQFAISEPGVENGVETWLVTDRHVRIDWGAEDDGFVLFDRAQKRIASVSHEERTVLVIKIPPESPAAAALGADVRLGRHEQTPDEAPKIGGRQPVEVSLLANDELCAQVAAVPGMLPDVVAAMREYQQALAKQQQQVLGSFPPEELTACRLADDVLAPTRDLDAGFPIIRWTPDGRNRQLIDFQEQAVVDTAVFDLPEGYDNVQFNH